MDALAGEAGITRAGVAVVAPRRARARRDACLEVFRARCNALLRCRSAPLETCESIACRPTTLHARFRLCHHTPRAGREGLAAPIDEGARTRTRWWGRRTGPEAIGVVARAGGLRGAELVRAAAHARPLVRSARAGSTALSARAVGDARRLETGFLLQAAAGGAGLRAPSPCGRQKAGYDDHEHADERKRLHPTPSEDQVLLRNPRSDSTAPGFEGTRPPCSTRRDDGQEQVRVDGNTMLVGQISPGAAVLRTRHRQDAVREVHVLHADSRTRCDGCGRAETRPGRLQRVVSTRAGPFAPPETDGLSISRGARATGDTVCLLVLAARPHPHGPERLACALR